MRTFKQWLRDLGTAIMDIAGPDDDPDRPEKYKMYILVKDSIPAGYEMVAAAHAPLSTYLKYQNYREMREWLAFSYRKVICKVTNEEFEKAKSVYRKFVLTEGTLDGAELAIGFCPRPRSEWPDWFRDLPLYGI